MVTEWHSLEGALSHPDNDKRIQALHALRDLLDQPDEQPQIAEPEALANVLKSSLKSNNSHVSNATLAVLDRYFESLPPSTLSLKEALSALLPGILDKLGDAKLATRDLARGALVSAAKTNLKLGIQAIAREREPPIWNTLETGLRDHGFHSKNAKAREQALFALLAIRNPDDSQEYPLPPLRPFTPLVLPLLADSDPSVRSTALSTTIAIFSAPSVNTAAKTDLKKAMAKLDLPKKVQDQVIQSVLAGGGSTLGMERSPSQASSSNSIGSTPRSHTNLEPTCMATIPSGPATRTRTRAALSSAPASSTPSTSTPSLVTSLPAAAFPSDPSAVHSSSSSNSVEPVYLASIADLHTEFERMKPCFEGKETEHNWIERDKSIARVRGMIEGGVCREEGEMMEEFVRSIKEIQDGIIKTSSSLRTTLAISALTLLTSLSTSLPPHLVDSLLDPFLAHCLSMASQTKKIVASASQQTVASFISRSNYHHKTTQLLVSGMSDKVVSARQHVSVHLSTLITTHSRSPRVVAMMDQTGGTQDLEESIKKGLADPNAGVRETTRTAYWEFERVWKERAEDKIRNGLDPQAKKLLDKVKPVDGSSSQQPTEGTREQQGEEVKGRNGRLKARSGTETRGTTEPVAGSSGAGEGAGAGSGSGSGSAKKPSMREMMLAAKKKKLAEEAANARAHAAEVVGPDPSARVEPGEAGPSSETPKDGDGPSTPLQSRHDPRPRPHHRKISTGSSDDSLSRQTRDSEAADESQLLQDVQSPFEAPTALTGQATPSRPPTKPSLEALPSPSSNMTRQSRRQALSSTVAPLDLPMLDPVVDESLRDQAMQAEQTAERLLEIAQEEEASGDRFESSSFEKGQASLSSGIGTTRAVTPRPSGKVTEVNPDQRTPVNGGKLLFGRRAGANNKAFEDSPDPRDGTGGGSKGTWWTQKAEMLEIPSTPLPIDSAERTEEINALVSALQSLEVDSGDFKKISALSRERRVAEAEDDQQSAASRWWREGRRFDKVYDGLRKNLLQADSRGNSRDLALIAFRDLVENQFPCFAGDEAGVYNLIFTLREDSSRTTIAATDAIATSFTNRLEPFYGLGVLCPSLESYLGSTRAPPESTARSFALALKLVATFFEALPAEVLEDAFPRTRELIHKGLNDQRSGDLRRAAINALVSAQSVLRDEKRLMEMMGGLATDQANLLSYYCAKRGV